MNWHWHAKVALRIELVFHRMRLFATWARQFTERAPRVEPVRGDPT
jgi:hypothetical protein